MNPKQNNNGENSEERSKRPAPLHKDPNKYANNIRSVGAEVASNSYDLIEKQPTSTSASASASTSTATSSTITPALPQQDLSIEFNNKLSLPSPSKKKACRLTSEDWFNRKSLQSTHLSNIPAPDKSFQEHSNVNDDDPMTSALAALDDINFMANLMDGFHTGDDDLEGVSADDIDGEEFVSERTVSTTSTNATATTLPPLSSDRPYTDKDVLLGRGGMTNKHPGNKRYRAEVERLKPWYHDCETKAQKKEVSQLLVDYIHHYGGRFLTKDAKTKEWVLADPKVARKKTSQALREAKWKPNQSEDAEKLDGKVEPD